MDSLEQPPPDAPAPPPDEVALESKAKWKAILLLGFGSMLGLLLMAPLTMKSRKNLPRTEALNNARQLSIALQEFEIEYGKFPDASTVSAVQGDTGSSLSLGTTTSNDFFRQLIATGLKSEKPFWMSSAASKRKPDDVTTPGKALAPGECAFGYITGLSSSDDPDTPVAFGPFVPGTPKFDPGVFGEKAIVITIDGSVTLMNINTKTGRVANRTGMDIFDPRQPWWGGKAPDIKLPE
jgi:hypothetical protein